MGMSSSQARLLNLTARMHQIEYKAAKLEAQKLQLANESSAVYDTYLEALDATKIQYGSLASDGTITYSDATYSALQAAGYILLFKDQEIIEIDPETEEAPTSSTAIYVDEATAANFEAAGGNEDYFIALQTGRGTVNDDGTITVTDDEDGIEWTEIYTASQLSSMDGSSGYYRLMSDIEITEDDDWESISSFSGTFDGNGHKISGLTSALFDSLSGATVTNLTLDEVNITTSGVNKYNVSSVGALANAAYGTTSVSNVSVSGSIDANGATYAGGLIGYCLCDPSETGSVNYIEIDNCYSSITIDNTNGDADYAGGIVGYATYTNITDCTVENAEICSSENGYIGGIAGSFTCGTMSNCYVVNSKITGGNTASGGLAGCSANADISGSTCYSTISSDNYAGTIVGYVTGNTTIAGFASGNTLTDTNGTTSAGSSGSSDYYAGYTDSSSSSSTSTLSSYSSGYSAAEIDQVTVDDTIDEVSGYTSASDLFEAISEYGYTTENVTYTAISDTIYISDSSKYSAEGYEDSYVWLTNMINEGYLYIYTYDEDEDVLTQVSVSTDTGLREVSDETNLKKAEAQYEADMKKIDQKDTRYDTQIAALDTERDAISSEMDTLDTVAGDNVERTFKLFSQG